MPLWTPLPSRALGTLVIFAGQMLVQEQLLLRGQTCCSVDKLWLIRTSVQMLPCTILQGVVRCGAVP